MYIASVWVYVWDDLQRVSLAYKLWGYIFHYDGSTLGIGFRSLDILKRGNMGLIPQINILGIEG